MQLRLPSLDRCFRVRIPTRAVPVVVAVALWLLGAGLELPRAQACSCSPPSWQRQVRPQPNELAPRNTRLWVTVQRSSGAPPTRVVLRDVSGAEVAVDSSEVAFGAVEFPSGLIVLTPRPLLEADSAYSFEVLEGDSERPVLRVSFRTSDAIDAQAPAVPAIAFSETSQTPTGREEIPSCLSGPGLAVGLDAEVWIAQRVRRAPCGASARCVGTPHFDPETLTGALSDFFPDLPDFPELIRGAPCSPAWDGAPTTMQFASLDLAGNFSGWSEPERFAASESATGNGNGGACSVRGGGLRATPGLEPTALGACAAIALLVRRARSRRS